MQLECLETSIAILLNDPRKKKPHRVDISPLRVLPDTEIQPLIESTFRMLDGKRYQTQHSYLKSAVLPFGRYCSERILSALPTNTEEWQSFLLGWYDWYLGSSSSKASLPTRIEWWSHFINPWLTWLMNEEILPDGLVLPSNRLPEEVAYTGSPRRPELIGEQPAKPTPLDHSITKSRPRTLAGHILNKPDETYLDEVEAVLRQRNQVLAQVADRHWNQLKQDVQHGRELMNRISDEEFADRLNRNDWMCPPPDDAPDCLPTRLKITHPRHPDAAAWSLRIMRHLLMTGDDETCLATKRLQAHPAFNKGSFQYEEITAIGPLKAATALSAAQLDQLYMPQIFMRFLGIPLPIDLAAACVILLQEHPNLTPEALLQAKLVNKGRKSHLIATDDKTRQLFSVDKARAGTRKYAHLTPRAQGVMEQLIEMTTPVRTLLKRAGSKHWRYLLLGYGSRGFTYPKLGSALLTSAKNLSLIRLFPEELEAAGLGSGTLDFSKIRNTQGVLEWFDTGSVRQVTRKLGNSYRVVIEHYLPPALVRLRNERLIRRFQNLLIMLAAHQEDYLLEVTDLRDYAELLAFTAQMLKQYPKASSPIADKLHERFGLPVAEEKRAVGIDKDAVLTVHLSGTALALLYGFQKVTLERVPHEALRRPDPCTGLVPQHFLDLAVLLRQAAEGETMDESLRITLQCADLKRFHASALAQLPDFVPKIQDIRISPTWSSP